MSHKRTSENPVTADVARVELGRPGPALSRSYFNALKKRMGLQGRYVLVSEMRQWRREHPEFRESDVYHRSGCACASCREKRQHPVGCRCFSCRGRRASELQKLRRRNPSGLAVSGEHKFGEQ